MINATKRMSSTVNDTLNHGAPSCITVSPYRAILSSEPYILMPVRAVTICHPERSEGPLTCHRHQWRRKAFLSLLWFPAARRFPRVSFLHRSANLPSRHPRGNFLSHLHLRRIFHQLPRAIEHQSIPPLQN